MSRINTNVSSLVAQHSLGRANESLQTSLTRLSTGLRINSGKDDPAGLIASENLRRDITSVTKAISNTERASQMIGTADSALGEISKLLNDIRGLVTEAANSGALSEEQIAANQLQIDSSLEAIDRIAQVTTFQGRKLLDGSLDFIVDSVPTSVTDLTIDQANLGTASSILVDVDITAAAEQAQLSVAASAFALSDDLLVQVSGQTGAEVFAFDSGATITQVVNAINLVSDATGVTATNNAGVLELDSVAYGTDAFVAVEVISEGGSGVFGASLSSTRDAGTDIAAVVNGVQASGKGNTLSINTASLDLTATVADGSSSDFSFTIEGGGAVFQLGPEVVSNQQARIGLSNVNTGTLGGKSGRLFQLRSGQSASLEIDVTTAASIVDETVTKVTSLRGRLGAFQRTTLQSNITSLQDTLVNITDAQSAIRDADFAAESAALTRAQILVQSGTQVLTIANQNPQNVLALLG
jgi:flagellin